jgi:hypothetical protein
VRRRSRTRGDAARRGPCCPIPTASRLPARLLLWCSQYPGNLLAPDAWELGGGAVVVVERAIRAKVVVVERAIRAKEVYVGGGRAPVTRRDRVSHVAARAFRLYKLDNRICFLIL